MPNQRSKDKHHLGGYVHKKLYAKVIRWAKKEGMAHDRFGFAAKLIKEGIERRECLLLRKNPTPNKVKPPKGYRLMDVSEVILNGDFVRDEGKWREARIFGNTVGMMIATEFPFLTAYARPIAKKGK